MAMIKKIKFTKMVGSGNDFVVIEDKTGFSSSGYPALARSICDRKFGAGADGLLVLNTVKLENIRMRIFNADGSEAEMCGNGARCSALYASSQLSASSSQLMMKIRTLAGVILAEVKNDVVKIKLTDPKDIKLNMPIKVNGRRLMVDFVNTGVPHAVIFVEGLGQIDVFNLGRQIRNHPAFSPKGTNVNFIEVLSDDSIRIRTYERGVEDETLACGTGSTASALIFSLKCRAQRKVSVYTKSGEILRVYFNKVKAGFNDVWLEGKARIVYQGEYKL